MKKLNAMIALILALALLLTACAVCSAEEETTAEPVEMMKEPEAETEADSIEGIWVMQYLKSEDPSDVQTAQFNAMLSAGAMVYIYMFKDGKLTTYVIFGGEPVEEMCGTSDYTIDENRIILSVDGETQSGSIEFLLDGDTLELLIPPSVGVFARKK